jgi:N-acetylglutamate synthase-like GNAT family acetyltransferase
VGGIVAALYAGAARCTVGAMATDLRLRRAEPADSRACFDVFRRSLADLMQRIGYATSRTDDIDATWPRYVPLFDHLAATCAEWWVVEDERGAVGGYARSVERSGMVELTEFFVAPETRVSGAGRALLERAFPLGWGEHRSIIATTDAPAVALYLRSGVRHQTTGIDVAREPGRAEPPAGTDVRPATAEDVLALEAELLGHGRPQDVAFITGDRPGLVVERGGKVLGCAFLPNAAGFAGPVAARTPEALPAVLAHLERAAHEAGAEQLELTVPLAAAEAMTWLLEERRFRLDPFYVLFLADGPWARLDRYLPFNPCFIL